MRTRSRSSIGEMAWSVGCLRVSVTEKHRERKRLAASKSSMIASTSLSILLLKYSNSIFRQLFILLPIWALFLFYSLPSLYTASTILEFSLSSTSLIGFWKKVLTFFALEPSSLYEVTSLRESSTLYSSISGTFRNSSMRYDWRTCILLQQ